MRFIRFGILLASLPHLAWADLPLTVENLITDKGKIKLDLSLSYANADRQGVSTAAPISVQVGPTSFVTLPTQIGEHVDNSDIAVAALGLRHGLTAKAEVYARLSGLSSRRRSSGLDGSATSSQSGFADAWAGVNYQFKKDDDGPAVLGFAEIALREKHRRSSASFKSAMLGATTSGNEGDRRCLVAHCNGRFSWRCSQRCLLRLQQPESNMGWLDSRSWIWGGRRFYRWHSLVV